MNNKKRYIAAQQGLVQKEGINYKTLVLADTGTLKDWWLTNKFIRMAKDNGISNNIVFSWFGESASKFRTSGIQNYYSKAYSTIPNKKLLGAELVNNGDVELITPIPSGSGNHSVTRISTDFHSGTACLDLVSTGVGDGGNNIGYTATVTLGVNYTRVFWAKSISGNTQLVCRSSSVFFGSTTPYTLTNQWQQFTLTQTATGTGNGVIFYLSGAGECLIDDISFKQVIPVVTDATQTTDLNQPYLVGNIAPNEKNGLYNSNGDSRYFTHPAISFSATEAWTVSTVFNWNGSNDSLQDLWGYSGLATLRLQNLTAPLVSEFISNEVISSSISNLKQKIIGKTVKLDVVASGDGTLIMYLNGVILSSYTALSNRTSLIINRFISGRGTGISGSVKAHIIRSGALTQSQITAEYNFFRNIYPEIPTVNISGQYWATSNLRTVCTPMGNLIQNITDNSNVEKITNAADRDFSSDTGFWVKVGNTTINNSGESLLRLYGIADCVYRGIAIPLKAWVKIQYTITETNNGILSSNRTGAPLTIVELPSKIGTHIVYVNSINLNGYVVFSSSGFIGAIDNISIQQVGWSDLTNLYTYIAATTAEAALSTEKITVAADRDFSSDTGYWSKGTNVTISGGTANFNNSGTGSAMNRGSILTSGRFYKLTYTVKNYVSGGVTCDSMNNYIYRTANGTYNEYFQSNGSILEFYGNGTFIGSIDDISIKELGSSGAIAAAIYEKAGCLAASAWCSYNNSIDNEVTYGKLYNWYAARLFDLDITDYNTANPSTPWGYRIPTSSDFTTLQTNLGGASVAGGKMKLTGLTYWNSPNVGATNESGFSALAGGVRAQTGEFMGIFSVAGFYSSASNYSKPEILSSNTNFQAGQFLLNLPMCGASIRLIKT